MLSVFCSACITVQYNWLCSFDFLHKKQSGGHGQYGRVIGYLEVSACLGVNCDTMGHFNFWLSLSLSDSLSESLSWTLKSGLRPKFNLTLDLDFRWAGSDSTPALPFSEFAGHGWNYIAVSAADTTGTRLPLIRTQLSTILYFCASLLAAQLQQLQSSPCSLFIMTHSDVISFCLAIKVKVSLGLAKVKP